MGYTYKPYSKRRLPRLTTEKLTEIARGYLNKKGQEPSDDECLDAVRSFDFWREYSHIDGHHRPVPRRPVYGRNADQFDRCLTLVLFWEKKAYVPEPEPFRQGALFDD